MKNKQEYKNGNKPTVAVYSFGCEHDACSEIRLTGPIQAKDWNIIWASSRDSDGFKFNAEAAHQADIVIIQRMFPCRFTAKLLRNILSLKIPVIYDLDDSFFDAPPHLSIHDSGKKNRPFIKWILKAADLITVSTTPLKLALSPLTNRPIHVNPNIVDFELFKSTPNVQNNRFNLLVSGTKSHQRDWSIIEKSLLKILNKYNKDIFIIFYGDMPDLFNQHPSVKKIDFQPSYKEYAKQLKQLNIHAALIPLEDIKFNHCKSNIKWLEYSSAGIPGAYSNITPYSACIKHEQTGLLVENTAESWFNAINQLIVNSENRINMAKKAQQEVFEQYSIENSKDKYLSVIENCIGQRHQQRITAELPIFHYRLYDMINNFLYKHLIWRFKG